MKTLPVLSPINQADFYNELLLGTNTYILYCVVNNDLQKCCKIRGGIWIISIPISINFHRRVHVENNKVFYQNHGKY